MQNIRPRKYWVFYRTRGINSQKYSVFCGSLGMLRRKHWISRETSGICSLDYPIWYLMCSARVRKNEGTQEYGLPEIPVFIPCLAQTISGTFGFCFSFFCSRLSNPLHPLDDFVVSRGISSCHPWLYKHACSNIVGNPQPDAAVRRQLGMTAL